MKIKMKRKIKISLRVKVIKRTSLLMILSISV